MAIIAPNPAGLTPTDRIAARLMEAPAQGDPLKAPAEPFGGKPPGMLESIGTSFAVDSVAGGLLLDTIPYLYGRETEIDLTPEEDFNPYDLLTDDFAREHPYALEDFESGWILHLPNTESFHYYLQRKRQDFEARETLGRNSFGKNLFAMIPGQALDAVSAAGLIKTLGLAGKATQVAKWAQSGGRLARLTKHAALGAIANEVQELGLTAINPQRNVNELQAHLMAVGSGAAFASLASFLAAGRGKLGQVVSTRRLRTLKTQISAAIELPETKAGVDAVERMTKDDAELLAGLLDESPAEARTVAILDHPANRAMLDKVKAKWGDNLIVAEHPQQAMVDWILRLQELDDSLTKATPASLSRVTQKYADLLSAWAPGSKIRNSPSLVARQAGRLFFDDTTPTVESLERPVTHAVKASAEALRWNYNHWRDTTTEAIHDALDTHFKNRNGPITYQTAGGETLKIRSHFHRRRFGRAVIDYLWQLDEASRGQRTPPDAPQAIRNAADAMRDYARKVGREAMDVRYLDDIDLDRIYVPRRWQHWQIAARRDEFISRLIGQWDRNRVTDINTGKPIEPGSRQLLDAIIEYERTGQLKGRGLTGEDRQAIRLLAKAVKKAQALAEKAEKGSQEQLPGQVGRAAEPTELTEKVLRDALGDDALARYHEEVDIYFASAGKSTADTLTSLVHRHGVEHDIPGVFKHRVLKINETDFADFLDDDLASLLGFHHRQTSGKIAARLAVKRSVDQWRPIVRKLTGKDLIAENYNPHLILDAIRRDFQNWIDAAAKLKDPKMLAQIEAARDLTDRILTQKLDELEGKPVFNDPAVDAGWKLLAKRTALNFPYMAYLGKMTVSAIPDIAGMVFYKGLTPKKISTVARALMIFKKMPRRGLEGLDVALNDSIRSLRAASLGDVADLVDGRQFGPGLKGKTLSRIDAGMNWMTEKFSRATLMDRWNTNMKRAAAHMIQQEMIVAARRMKQAGQFMAQGLSETAAVKKAGLSPHDALRLNRLGINADRATRLLDTLYAHGVDIDGSQPWKGNRAAFDAHEGAIFPELNKWWNTDRDLFETFTAAVNSETQNIIVEPKLMSRPLINATWTGRAFNQFQSFAFAWGNQFAQMAAQRPAIEQAQYITWAVGLGGLSEAIHNHLAGRRSFDETAELWRKKPMGMVYASIDRAGITGWLARPLGWMEKTPWGPAKSLGIEKTSQRSAQIQGLPGILGPFADWTDRLMRTTQRAVFNGEVDRRTLHSFRVLTPFNNLWSVTAAERLAEDAGLIKPRD